MTDSLSTILTLTLAAMLGIYALAMTARYPQVAILATVLVLMWPQRLDLVGVPVQQPITALLLIGVLISGRHELRRHMPVLTLVGAFMALVAASHIMHGPTVALTTTEARNAAATLCLNIGLVACVAIAAPRTLTTLKVIALSGVAASSYLYMVGDRAGGRLALDDLNPNTAGHAAAITITVLIGLAWATRQWAWLLLTIPPLWTVAASQSRGALVVLGLGLAALLITAQRGRTRTMWLALLPAVMLLLWGPLNRVVTDGILTTRDGAYLSTDARTTVLDLAANASLAHPLTGIGYGHFLDYSAPYLGVPLNTHNDWVRIAVECGLPALVLLLVLLLIPIRRLHLPRRHAPVIVATIVAVSTSFMFANTMTDLRVSLPIWLCLGLAWTQRPATLNIAPNQFVGAGLPVHVTPLRARPSAVARLTRS